MLTIRWGLDEVAIYTLNEAVIKINTVLGYQWNMDDLVRHAQEGVFRLFCKVDDVPVVRTRWGRCFHILEIIQQVPFTLFPNNQAEFDRCEIIKEIACFSGFCSLPAAQLRLLAQGQHPIHLSHIEQLNREGCPTAWEVMNLPAWIERYEPLLSEMNSSHQVLVECLKLNLKGTEREYLEELQGTVAISLNQCWVDTESVENFIKELAIAKHKEQLIIQKRIEVIRKVLKGLGYDDPADFKPFSKTIKESKSIKIRQLYDLCLLEDEELFKGISHPDKSESFRTEVWAEAKKIFLLEKQKDTTVG